jgi:hypothetical protein
VPTKKPTQKTTPETLHELSAYDGDHLTFPEQIHVPGALRSVGAIAVASKLMTYRSLQDIKYVSVDPFDQTDRTLPRVVPEARFYTSDRPVRGC